VKAFSNGIRAYEWSYKQFKVLTLENKKLRVSLLPHKGSDIVEIRYKPKDVNVLLVLPLKFFLTTLPPSLRGTFFDYYEGGWQDIMPTAGEASFELRGVRWEAHGESSLIPWEYSLIESNDEVNIRLSTELIRYPFKIEKVVKLREDSDSFEVYEKITNASDEDLEYMWLQHIMFSKPFLSSDCRIDIPAKTVITHGPPNFSDLSFLKPGVSFEWPYSVTREDEKVDLSTLPTRYHKVYDIAYVTDLEEGRFSISSLSCGLSLEFRFPKEVFKYLWLMYVFGGPSEYPWYGRVWAFGIMPCTSYPACGLLRAIENRTARTLKGNGSVEAKFTITLHEISDA